MTPCARPHPQKCGSITRTPSTPRTDRHLLEHFALYLTKSHPKQSAFHFASLWERAPVIRATSAALWQAAARIVIHAPILIRCVRLGQQRVDS